MPSFSLSHLSDSSLDRALESAARDASVASAWLLAHIAESDVRRRYLPAGFPSMFDYCVRCLRFSEDAAYKRIRVARAARRVPAIFGLIAEGRLHLTGALLLVPYLTTANAGELLAAATHRTKSEIEHLLAGKFPRPDVPELVVALPPAPPTGEDLHTQLAPEPVGMTSSEQSAFSAAPADTMPPPLAALESAPERVTPVEPRPRVTPLAPERFAIQCTVGKSTHDKLRHAQDLLRHAVPDGSLEAVLERALDALIVQLEKRRCAATERPRETRRRPSANPRHIPAAVRRAVWARDGGRCTFVGEHGRRCEARGHLELDHVEPVARGGASTVGNLRLRCRAHNQFEAERVYGPGFMRHKREAARSGTSG